MHEARTVARRPAAVALIVAAMAQGCLESPGQPPSDTVRFVAFGDWGAEPEAIEVLAAGMWSYCQSLGCDLALGLGDNFYEAGVTGTDDPQWVSKWARPFADWDIPLFMTLGNHDYFGDVQAQLDHGAVDRRWNMPAPYYDFVEQPVHFIALDTTTLAEDSQARWLARTVRTAGSPWRIAFGHHPWRSNGLHGNAAPALRTALEWGLCGRADLYLAGHDHDLQLLQPECGVTLAISASGARPRPVSFVPAQSAFAYSNPGFLWARVDERSMVLRFVTVDGVEVYEHTLWVDDRPLDCAVDGICTGDCPADPDCIELSCDSDGTCEDRCTDDPDCFGACDCDQLAGVCEPHDNTSTAPCACDPTCRGEARACAADRICDLRCPADSDPDC